MRFKAVVSTFVAAAALLGAGSAAVRAQEAPQVVASIKPVHSLVAGVMQGVGEPHLLVRGGASPHTYVMRPSDARALQAADVVVWVGEDLEIFLTGPISELGDARTVELAEAQGIELLPTRAGGIWSGHDHGDHAGESHEAAMHDHAHDGAHDHADDHAHEHADEHGHSHDHDHDHADEHAHTHDHDHADDHDHANAEGHAHGEYDMHVWLDTHNAAAMIDAIAAALAEADPARADTYRANAADLQDRIEGLDAELAERLAPVRDRPFIVFHDAYQYFEEHYGLSPAGSVTVSPDIRPGAARLTELREHVETRDAVCVFAEPQFEPTLVETIVEGTGARAGVLDPLGAEIENGPDLYFAVMRNLADSLRDCLMPSG